MPGALLVSRISLLWRSLFLIVFLVAMPILALPSVARRLDDYLYGHEESPLIAGTTSPLAEEVDRDGIAQATFEVPMEPPVSRAGVNAERGLDAAVASPPPMAATPEFEQSDSSEDGRSLAIPIGPSSSPSSELDLTFKQEDFDSSRPQRSGPSPGIVGDDVNIVRQRLEDLGADSIVLEADESGQYRFHCRMLVSAGSEETESFEATGSDAQAVAQQVLKTVEDWRSSQVAPIR